MGRTKAEFDGLSKNAGFRNQGLRLDRGCRCTDCSDGLGHGTRDLWFLEYEVVDLALIYNVETLHPLAMGGAGLSYLWFLSGLEELSDVIVFNVPVVFSFRDSIIHHSLLLRCVLDLFSSWIPNRWELEVDSKTLESSGVKFCAVCDPAESS